MESLPISFYCGGPDMALFRRIVNQGIDARLEAFTKSKFEQDGSRYLCDFDASEVQLLLRRLYELTDIADEDMAELADEWETEILMAQYGVEVI